MTDVRSFILLKTQIGKKKEKDIFRAGVSRVEVLAGTLLILVEERPSSHGPLKLFLQIDGQDGTVLESSVEDLQQLSKVQFELLQPVPSCKECLEILYDKEWLHDGEYLQRGDRVLVNIKGHPNLLGVIRYKGLLPGMRGIYFGVELLDGKGNGTSDGVFRRKRFFSCLENNGIFVGINKLRREKMPQTSMEGADAAAFYLDQPEIRHDFHLKMGDRVIWMSDMGPEGGVVKWIGILPNLQNHEDVTVGVEFDNPVGSGTGKYKDRRLFSARQNHASLVPILGLIAEKEFNSQNASPRDEDSFDDMLMGEFVNIPDSIVEHKNAPLKYSDDNREPRSNPLLKHQHQKDEAGYKAVEIISEQPGSWGSIPRLRNRLNSASPVDPDLSVGSMVEVMHNPPWYGVIRWIGNVSDQKDLSKPIAGLEMEEEISAGTDGTFAQQRFFECAPRRAFFIPLYKCQKDKRFLDQEIRNSFGSIETPDVSGNVSPPDSFDELLKICGKNRGIQGHHNSCYLDATLFVMFFTTTVFDSILYRPRRENDLEQYEEVKKVLKEGIVNPLRMFYYVRADKVMKLRQLLDKLGSVTGMMTEEKDPEEFLDSFLQQLTKTDPLLQISLSDGQIQQAYFYQLIMEKDEKLVLPTTQQLFELSFLQMDIKLKEIPSCLIIQMPRFGKDYKMYRRIIPSLELDITDVLENAPRECIICGDLAAYECSQCYQVHGAGLNTIAFCEPCKMTSHQHKNRVTHRPRAIKVPGIFKDYYFSQRLKQRASVVIRREKMELFAVVCIHTSHYVSFAKCGRGVQAPWVFFDSMADRMGEQSGYNIPEITLCEDLPTWLHESYQKEIMKEAQDKNLPEHMRRLLCDAYMCMYQSPTVQMYK